MRTTVRLKTLGLVAALTMTVAACGARDGATGEGDPGITDDEITIGTSYPLSGPASAYAMGAVGMEAYFDFVNDKYGGVEMGDGKTRKINFIALDDGYDPARTVTNVQRLVEQEEVFAIHNLLGTPTHTAVVDYLNEQQVPDVFVGSVAHEWSQNATTNPWTVGWQPTNEIEAEIYGQAVVDSQPDAKVAILYQNDDAGKPAVEAFTKAIEGSDVEIVGTESYEVTAAAVDSQVAALAKTKADVFINVSSPKAAAQSIARAHELGWKPTQYINSTASSIPAVLEPAGLDAAKGAFTVEWLKVPTDPRWEDDPAMEEFRTVAEKYAPDADATDRLLVYGMAAAQTLVETLKRIDEPTRENLMETVRSLDPALEIPLLLPGIRVETDSENILPIRQMQLQQFNGKEWEITGDVYEGGVSK